MMDFPFLTAEQYTPKLSNAQFVQIVCAWVNFNAIFELVKV